MKLYRIRRKKDGLFYKGKRHGWIESEEKARIYKRRSDASNSIRSIVAIEVPGRLTYVARMAYFNKELIRLKKDYEYVEYVLNRLGTVEI
jgi:hypothetical protein